MTQGKKKKNVFIILLGSLKRLYWSLSFNAKVLQWAPDKEWPYSSLKAVESVWLLRTIAGATGVTVQYLYHDSCHTSISNFLIKQNSKTHKLSLETGLKENSGYKLSNLCEFMALIFN